MPRLTKTQAGLAAALKKQFGASLPDERAALARPSGSGGTFPSMLRANQVVKGQQAGLEWMATHIGKLRDEMDAMQKQVRRLQKQLRQNKGVT